MIFSNSGKRTNTGTGTGTSNIVHWYEASMKKIQ